MQLFGNQIKQQTQQGLPSCSIASFAKLIIRRRICWQWTNETMWVSPWSPTTIALLLKADFEYTCFMSDEYTNLHDFSDTIKSEVNYYSGMFSIFHISTRDPHPSKVFKFITYLWWQQMSLGNKALHDFRIKNQMKFIRNVFTFNKI